ncbi:hypothetical protein [Roseateles terrae]|uniref:Low-complexity protein n=1 Tax=Roseateles terrae TaxID=431060 RepID=A0ABR6H078_9BURK|nr:hypothetical protein [Roseateles terrae]MBB3196843.1 putative low-complexity protein [Roseateles terrae]OWQ84597.1 hypothetical protein CDN98_19050 [Roseateles terrae]
MRYRLTSLATAALLAAAATAVQAESFVSSASSAGSESSGSVSDSIGASSNSSKKDDRKVGQGRYRVVEVAAAEGRPGMMQVALAADEGVSPDAMQTFNLYVPAQALAQQPLAAGQRVRVKERDYGLEFSDDASQRPFFLVLEDGWRQQMRTQMLKA